MRPQMPCWQRHLQGAAAGHLKDRGCCLCYFIIIILLAMACGTWDLKLCPLQQKRWVSAIGPPGMSKGLLFKVELCALFHCLSCNHMTSLYKILVRHNNLSLLPVPSQASKLFFSFLKKILLLTGTVREPVVFKTAVFCRWMASTLMDSPRWTLPVQTFQQDPLILRNPDGGKLVCVLKYSLYFKNI